MVLGTPRWAAPEIHRASMTTTAPGVDYYKADVYSYAIVCIHHCVVLLLLIIYLLIYLIVYLFVHLFVCLLNNLFT